MRYINFFKSKKILVLIIGFVLIAGIAGLYIYSQKSTRYKIIIQPTELLPYVSHEQARTNVCKTMKGKLFDEVCQKKFEKIGKSDGKKIGELLLLLQNIERDHNISTYDKILLSQSIFASLPTKDSPLVQRNGLPAILSSLNNFLNQKNIAHAAEPNDSIETDEANLRKIMENELAKMIKDLPKGDNAWAISIMVSKHEWIDGEPQPIYSEHYLEVFDPYPGISYEDKSGWEQRDNANMLGRVGSNMTNGNVWTSSNYKGSSVMIGYAFNIMSWKSKKYAEDSVLVLAEAGPSEQYLTSNYHYTEKGYDGDDLLTNLMNAVAMPSRVQKKEEKKEELSTEESGIGCGTDPDKRLYPPGTQIENNMYELIKIINKDFCPYYSMREDLGLYCYCSEKELMDSLGDNAPNHYSLYPPTYPFVGTKPWEAPKGWIPEGYILDKSGALLPIDSGIDTSANEVVNTNLIEYSSSPSDGWVEAR